MYDRVPQARIHKVWNVPEYGSADATYLSLAVDILADVELLTPTRKGPLGVDALNVLLQRLVQMKLRGIDVPPPAPNRRPEFLLGDDTVAAEDALGLEAGQLHRHDPRHTSSVHVPDG